MILSFFQQTYTTIKKHWLLILVTTVVVSTAYASFRFLASYNKLTISMSLNYPAAEKGLNPDGTRFNAFEIKSVEVLDKALEKYSETGITVDELRSRIDVYARASNTITEKVRNAKLSGENFKYIPNEYSISYSQKNKLSKNHTHEMLEAITQAYREVFEAKHADNNEILKVSGGKINKFDQYEYVEIADLLLDDVTAIESYIAKRKDENSSYLSTETGETFANILAMIQNFRDIEVERYKAFVVSSAIAKDREEYLNKLRYNAQTLDFERSKAVKEAEFVRDAIRKYDPNITGVAFIPSLDVDNEFYMNRTKTGIDYLATRAYTAGINAEKITKDIEDNRYLIEVFSNKKHTPEEASRLAAIADQMLSDLEERILYIQSLAVKTDDEYISYKTRDYVKFNIPEKSIVGNFSLVRTVAFAFGFFCMMCMLVVLKEQFFRKLHA